MKIQTFSRTRGGHVHARAYTPLLISIAPAFGNRHRKPSEHARVPSVRQLREKEVTKMFYEPV